MEKDLTKFAHQACVGYLDAVNNVRNRNTVQELLFFTIEECPTNLARQMAVSSLATSGNPKDGRITQVLVNIVNLDSDFQTRKTALHELRRYDLGENIDQLIEWLEDANVQIRRSAANIALKYNRSPVSTESLNQKSETSKAKWYIIKKGFQALVLPQNSNLDYSIEYYHSQ